MQTEQPKLYQLLTLPSTRLVKLGIQGAPGSGKTIAACTFPNPHFISIENTLPDALDTLKFLGMDHTAIKVFPFYDPEFVVKYLKEKKCPITHTLESKILLVRDAIRYFIKDDAAGYSNPSMTWVLDSWTRLHDFFDLATWDEKHLTKDGKIDNYVPWELKIDYSREILNNLLNQNANIIVIFHESQTRSATTGELLEKTAPLMQGKFIARIKEFFPNFFRSVVKEQLDSSGKPIFNNNTKRIEVDYQWQVGADGKFDSKCSKPGLPMYVKADYKSLI